MLETRVSKGAAVIFHVGKWLDKLCLDILFKFVEAFRVSVCWVNASDSLLVKVEGEPMLLSLNALLRLRLASNVYLVLLTDIINVSFLWVFEFKLINFLLNINFVVLIHNGFPLLVKVGKVFLHVHFVFLFL